VPILLAEIVKAFGGGQEPAIEPSRAAEQEYSWLDALAQPLTAGQPDADALAILRTVRDALRDVCPPHTGLEVQCAGLATDPEGLRRRAEKIADIWRRVIQKRGESTRSVEPAHPQQGPLPDQGRPKTETRDVQPERETPPAKHDASSAPSVDSGVSPKISIRPGSPSGMTVECTFPASGTEAACVLRGEIARINDMGLLAAFEERLPEGAPMVVRFVRGGEVVACRGRVVRVQESAGTSAGHPTLHHLIRFESTTPAF
jgi:hypothetical protein